MVTFQSLTSPLLPLDASSAPDGLNATLIAVQHERGRGSVSQLLPWCIACTHEKKSDWCKFKCRPCHMRKQARHRNHTLSTALPWDKGSKLRTRVASVRCSASKVQMRTS